MKVIDVSTHNGTINWTSVKNDGIEGVIIRAGYGKLASQKDPMFETNCIVRFENGLFQLVSVSNIKDETGRYPAFAFPVSD